MSRHFSTSPVLMFYSTNSCSNQYRNGGDRFHGGNGVMETPASGNPEWNTLSLPGMYGNYVKSHIFTRNRGPDRSLQMNLLKISFYVVTK